MSELTAQQKLDALRESMEQYHIDTYIIPSEDAHASEYLSPSDTFRAYITQFTGSAGCAVVTLNHGARCWTDGRYWVQAENQLGEGWKLMKMGAPDVPTWTQWVAALPAGTKVGIDPTVIPYNDAQNLLSLPNASLIPVPNLVSLIWPFRPQRPSNPIFALQGQYTGEDVGSKLCRVRGRLVEAGYEGMVVGGLDEIAWLFNLRGSDIPYNPVFFAYAIITRDESVVFLNQSSVSPQIRDHLEFNKVKVMEYDLIWTALEEWKVKLGQDGDGTEKNGQTEGRRPNGAAPRGKEKVLLGLKMSWAVARAVGEDNVEIKRSFIEEFKAKKNATELAGFRECHIRDGLALSRYLAWLEEALSRGEEWTEFDAGTKLEEFRKDGEGFRGLSFETISSTGGNGAIIHYAPPEKGSAMIEKDKMYLCDSGAQYLDGTTDITRTVHFGTPTEEQKRAFTRVLQGHIALDTIVFPEGTTGYVLDILARRPLWSDGLDYRHSTSHGIGSFLNVHEGPQGVGQRIAYNDVPLTEGMVISNEPGYYKETVEGGEEGWGIRIEGVDVIVKKELRNDFGGKGWLGLEQITMCPIQTSLIIPSLLTSSERDWINTYHKKVYDNLISLALGVGDERVIKWLERECAPIV